MEATFQVDLQSDHQGDVGNLEEFYGKGQRLTDQEAAFASERSGLVNEGSALARRYATR